jgi:hypothetical protein
MVHVDHHLGDIQELLLEKLVWLGFNAENVNYIVDKALKLVDKRNYFRHFPFRNEKNMNK